MKVLIIFLSLVVMGCVTAKNRNPSMLAHESTTEDTTGPAGDYEACLLGCIEDNNSFKECNPICATLLGVDLSSVENKKPLKVADYGTCITVCLRDQCDCPDPCYGTGSCRARCHKACYRE